MTTSLTTKPKTSLASQFLDIFEFSETTKTLEVFIEKSILIILNSRLNSQKTSSSNKLNSSFNIPENEIPEISDFFFDEYNDLFEPSPKTTNNYIIELEYRKGKHKFLIEKYEIQYSFIAENVHNNSKLTQQLTSILRMIHSLTRSLPAREFTQFKHDKNKSINYRIFSCQKHMNDFIYGEKVHKIKLDTEDICSNIKVNVNVEYLSKESLVRIENDYSKISYSYGKEYKKYETKEEIDAYIEELNDLKIRETDWLDNIINPSPHSGKDSEEMKCNISFTSLDGTTDELSFEKSENGRLCYKGKTYIIRN
jgi:hypothetical protein